MLFYQLIIRLYFSGIWLSSFFSKKAGLWIAGRKDWKENLKNKNFESGKWVWFHCSSFGEFQEGKFLIKKFRSEFPQYKILLTFFSPSGFEAQKNSELADVVFYLPLDTKKNAKYFLDIVNPCAAFFVRGDIWPNFISENSHRGIPQFLVSFIFSSSSFTGFPQRSFYAKIFSMMNHVFVQNEDSKTKYEQYAFGKNVSVCGNLRVENILETVDANYENEAIKKFIAGRFCVIAASTHSKDVEIFLEVVDSNSAKNICWIIVPHEVNQEEIENGKLQFKEKMVCLSDSENISPEKNLLWIDKIGILAKVYRYVDVAFVGGGFTKAGVHSFLEAVAYGCPVCFGSNYRNYTEAIDLLKAGTAAVVKDEKGLKQFIERYETNPDLLNKVNISNRNYLRQRTGATEKILNHLRREKYLT